MVQPMVDLNYFGTGGIAEARFAARGLAEQPYTSSGHWRTNANLAGLVDFLTALDDRPAEVQSQHSSCGGSSVEVVGDGWAAYMSSDGTRWSVQVTSADSMDFATTLIAAAADLAGPPPRGEAGTIPLTVWTESPMGGGARRYTQAKVGPWGDVADNYPGEVREQLNQLAAGLPDPDAGGLVVFCGPAGTGKTRATEALIASWCEHADISLVVDADRLLGSASYLADVISDSGDQRHVIIVEDGDAMMGVGEKKPEVAKLLNVADGLLGRCAGSGGTLWVLTANLDESDVASYVKRPGRAAAVVPFRHFTAEEATAWAASRGVERSFEAETTLAELYAGR